MPFNRDERTAWINTRVDSECSYYTAENLAAYDLLGYTSVPQYDADTGQILYNEDGSYVYALEEVSESQRK